MAYIDRDKLLEELQEEIDFESAMYTEEQNKWFKRGLKCAYRDAKNQPSADVVEVRHGEWTVKTDFKTPLSHAYIRKEIIYICPYCNKVYRSKMNFCGNCGAKMDGGKKE